ncbi:HNH endonuclease signature motif containing protein [Nocardioides sp. GY 10127]|uniref:HNH endonuclease signature motif containing protein n=1 Tax=Nocardioides sp. GY 10127 TaxID=2569762 RepID=UPI0010A8BD08|nr:HNH endonuclease signature motif containing protein [Nocardioides sp. GY 10127]TIC81005.1 HNH endonuclease [Nocardioides sp. GY 10127]
MTSTAERGPGAAGAQHPTDVLLARARGARRARHLADVALAQATVGWVEAHPEQAVLAPANAVAYAADTPAFLHGDRPLELGGPGSPLVTEAAVVEWAAALGMSTDAGRAFVGQVVELRYRLPRTWAAMTRGTVLGSEDELVLADAEALDHALPWFKARLVARATLHLPAAGADFVDAQLAAVAHRVGPAALERLVTEALVRFDPEAAEQQAIDAADTRHVRFAETTLGHRMVDHTGVVCVDATLDVTDAADLEAALAQVATELRESGHTGSLDARRAAALGEIARRQLQGRCPQHPDHPAAPTTRDLTLYLHVSEDAVRAAADGTAASDQQPLARVEAGPGSLGRLGGGFTTLEVLARWVTESPAGTRITIRPVIDQRLPRHAEAYEFPDRLKEQVRLAEPTCVFPWCRRPSRRADVDHVRPHGDGGSTSTANAAPLCRTHHRAKTHLGWAYERAVDLGGWRWWTRRGRAYLVTPLGTTALADTRASAGTAAVA